ncbi:MAG: hypothetical protein KDB60_17670 [Propionibacteriaceae bacterium]|nr:hypothetical protein [Propionibacteriaceae bacterium]
MANDEPTVALPAGLVELPELGEGVVGTRVAEAARWMLWAKAAGWLLVAGFALWLTAQAFGSVAGLLLGLLLAASCAFMATGNLTLARMGSRPVLTVDPGQVRCHVPLNRGSVRLDAITRVDRVRRDVLIEARGGISRSGRPSGARWFAINGAHTFDVSRADLVAYLSARATASRAPQ